MGYPVSIDEYSDERLMQELARRKADRKKGVCDYCQRNGRMPECREKERHALAKSQADFLFNDGDGRNSGDWFADTR